MTIGLRSVVVIGGGIAGTAAALAARRAGAEVTIALGGAGASTLSSGALDLTRWDGPTSAPAALDAQSMSVLDALDAFTIPASGALLATVAGIVRPARGADRALLDLAALPAGVVLVPKSDHQGWDATTLARGWNHARLARERSLQFCSVDAQITRFVDERMLVDAELAARHDDPARIAWLAERLKEAIARAACADVVAVLLPSWLGFERSCAAALRASLGIPCGEAIGMPGGPSGFRFERARTRALVAAEIATVRGRVTKIAHTGTWRVSLEEGAPLSADRVIVAAGGLIGGGIAYEPSAAILAGAIPPHARPTFACTIEGPLAIGLRGHSKPMPGSLFGEPPESLAWPFTDDPALDRAGILTGNEGRVASSPEGLYAAGDAAADRPRTWLAALEGGARAGHAAAQ